MASNKQAEQKKSDETAINKNFQTSIPTDFKTPPNKQFMKMKFNSMRSLMKTQPKINLNKRDELVFNQTTRELLCSSARKKEEPLCFEKQSIQKDTRPNEQIEPVDSGKKLNQTVIDGD